jgi:predicted AAA+ superfamily ATPase
MFVRSLQEIIETSLDKQKVSILLGARRVGKTILLQSIKNSLPKSLWLDGEDINVQKLLEERTISNYKSILANTQHLFIDEAQTIPDIGKKVKLMIDQIKPLHIVLTGSSAFDLYQQGEPLVGRSYIYHLYPIAQTEIDENQLETRQNLEGRLIYGSYPEVFSLSNPGDKRKYLVDLVNTYLLKDILAYQDVRQPQKLKDLLILLAYQIGNEVSLNELSRNLGINKHSVERYLDLLAKVYVIYNRRGYSKNLRKEIVKNNRWYFFDNGVRNALISNFNPLSLRQDTGQLWENYILSERIKKNEYTQRIVNSYFWRTYDQQEIDLIEEENASIAAFECKWSDAKVKIPVAFKNAYPDARFEVVNQNNYIKWIS